MVSSLEAEDGLFVEDEEFLGAAVEGEDRFEQESGYSREYMKWKMTPRAKMSDE